MENNLVPSHVAIIMDGNGRWAKQRGLARTQGHEEGLRAAKRIVLAARLEGISFLSLYTFSTRKLEAHRPGSGLFDVATFEFILSKSSIFIE